MSIITLTQGDDWEIDGFLERLVDGVWVPETLTGKALAMSVARDGYQQALTINTISSAGGQFRVTLGATASAQAPIGTLKSNLQVTSGGLRASTLPVTFQVLEDFTP